MTRTVLRTLTFALAAAAFALVLGTVAPSTPAQAPVLPDLVADPVEDPLMEPKVVIDGQAPRRLLRFDGFVHNKGPGKLVVRGESRLGNAMTSITQQGVGPMPDGTTLRFEATDRHNHWHLGNAAAYSLRDRASGALVAPAQKVGFCLLDSVPVAGGPRDYRADECMIGFPGADSVEMALSPGWRDVYDRDVWLQWVDISNVQPGLYRIGAEMDPDNRIAESNNANNVSVPAGDPPITIEGWRAEPSTATALDREAASTIQLKAGEVDDPAISTPMAAPEYKIVSGPSHGTVNRTTNEWFDGGSVVYQPDADAPLDGEDSITFAVREKGATFPESPATATLSMQLEALPDLEITGAPSHLEVGKSVNLDTNLDDEETVTWSEEGAGSITDEGVYTAPSTAGGPHKIRAQLGDTRSDEVEITIVAEPPLDVEGPATLYTRQSAQLSVVDGSPDGWSIHPAGAGSIDDNGTYTAPTTPIEDVVITATRGTRSGGLTLDVVAPPAVAISGAPSALIEGTSATLTASQPNVTWTTNRGSITPAGVYTAPAKGAGTTALVTATTPFGATSQVAIGIVAPKPVVPIPIGDEDLLQPVTPSPSGEPTDVLRPLPFTEPEPKQKSRRAPVIDRLSARRSGPYVVVSLRPGRTGRLRVSLLRGQRWLRSCRTKVRAGRPISCRLKTSSARRGLRIVATLDPAGRAKPVVRRKAVVTAHGHRHKHS